MEQWREARLPKIPKKKQDSLGTKFGSGYE